MLLPRRAPRTARAGSARLGVRVASLAATLGTARAAEAQDTRAGARVELGAAATAIRGDLIGAGSGAILFEMRPGVALGAAGTLLLGSRSLDGSVPGTELDLSFAYGGLVLHVDLPSDEGPLFWARLTTGAGNAKLELAAAGTRIAADNLGVLIPEVGVVVPLAGPLAGAVSVGYRATFGVDDLPGVTASDLRGPIGGIAVVLRHR